MNRRTPFRAVNAVGAKQKGDAHRILTPIEEKLIAQYCSLKKAAGQALSSAEILSTMVSLLKRRKAINVRGGTHYPLSKSTLHVLLSGTVTSYFWQPFFADHPELKEGVTLQTSQKRQAMHARHGRGAHQGAAEGADQRRHHGIVDGQDRRCGPLPRRQH